MHQAQLAISEVKRFYKRRKKIIIICSLLILGISIGAAYWLPPQYEASISILVDQEETLNPMVRFNLAVALASEDRLKSFNEIIYSRSTMNVFIDSLGLADEDTSDKERQQLINQVRRNITTTLRASDSFSITYIDTDPVRAKQAVTILSDYFIKTKLQLENKRNNQTVEFFQEKLAELQQTVEQRESEVSRRIRESVKSTPRENRSLQTDLDQVMDRRNELTAEIRNTQNRLEVVRDVTNGVRDLDALYQIDLSSVAFGEEMETYLSSYKELSRKYTSNYPRLQELDRKIRDLTEQMATDLESRLFSQQAQMSFLDRQRDELSNYIEQHTMVDRQTEQSQLDLDIYRGLYDEMKVKLEQAKTTRDLGKNAKEQFVVIDPPVIPQEPAKPNRVMLIGGGLGLGLFLGLMSAVIAELLDTTVRRPQDLEKFNKPVVAFIAEE